MAQVVGVVSQPDRPAGRGLIRTAPAVKTFALEAGLELIQPEKVRTGELEAWLRARQADVALVLAYGRILPPGVLDAPRFGCVNLHASLLPRYRGSAPIQWAILRGDTQTGISLMQMDAGMDTGPVYSRHAIGIGPDETGGELADRLAKLAAEVTLSDLPTALAGELIAEPQDSAAATTAPPIERDHGRIAWQESAATIHNLVRALAPRPGATTSVRGKQLRLTKTRLVAAAPPLAPGELRVERPRILVGTANGALELVAAQLEGKREMPALDLANGRALVDGERLGA